MVSKRLEAIKDIDPDSSLTLRQIDEIFGEDGAPVTILFLCLPFLFPMPIPGISTAFGFAIILLTIRIASPKPLPLPKFTDRITLSGKVMAQIAEMSLKHICLPRVTIHTHHITHRTTGKSIQKTYIPDDHLGVILRDESKVMKV